MSQEVRDAVARLEGWTCGQADIRVWMHPVCRWTCDHPIPDDLTACAKAWDDHAGSKEAGAWEWWRSAWGWHAVTKRDGKFVKVYVEESEPGTDAASELRDRWELLGLVLKAMGKL